MQFEPSKKSLADLVEHLNELEWRGELLLTHQRRQVVNVLKQFHTGNSDYLGFCLSAADFTNGARLFTGERLHTQLGLNYVLGLEICRQLQRMDGFLVETREIIKDVNQRLLNLCFVKDDCLIGECAYSLVAFWRYLISANWLDGKERINHYVRLLKSQRDGNGRWNRFPFYYTLMVLFESDTPQADAELAYALPACQRSRNFITLPEPYAQRRKELVDQVDRIFSVKQVQFSTLGV
ncbi:MAG: hypothetical protein CL609_18545 [Anaerolineaceae bacterium]|nr:hypothetical protein [Anaerolineaceae bacterium]